MKNRVQSSVNGMGVTFLDFRKQGEGVYAATRWVTLFYLPLVPLGQLLVRPIALQADPMRRSYQYEILEKQPLSLGSVLKTYAMGLLAVVPLLFAFLRMDTVNDWVGEGPGFFVTLSTIAWFVFLVMRFANADRVFKKENLAQG